MKDVNLTLAQTFYHVAREGSYAGAARRLNISYQSAANHVRRLEQSLGYSLLHSEQGKTNELTARGKKLFHLLMPEFDTMLARLNNVIEAETPLIRIGMPQAIFYYLFPKIIEEFAAAYENSQVHCFERDIALVDMVTSGQLDAFITERSVTGRAVRQYLIGSYKLILIYPKHWPKPDPRNLTDWADGKPLITYEPEHIIRNMALRNMSGEGKQPRVHVSTSGSSSLKRCVAAQLGFAILPGWTVSRLPENTAKIDLDDWPRIPVYFGEATYLEHNPYIKTMRELCLERLAVDFEQP